MAKLMREAVLKVAARAVLADHWYFFEPSAPLFGPAEQRHGVAAIALEDILDTRQRRLGPRRWSPASRPAPAVS